MVSAACLSLTRLVQKHLLRTLLIISLLFIFFFAPGISARANPASHELITLSEKNVSLQKIFKEITRQTGYRFIYTGSLLKNSAEIDINVKQVSLEQLLDICLRNQNLAYTILEKTVIIKEKKANPVVELLNAAPPAIVRGKIINQAGEPLSGATIIEKGTGNITTSKDDGSFSITVSKANTLLLISFIGYNTQEMMTGNQTVLLVSLKQSNSNLNDIVVIGYGSSKRKDLTGAVASLGNKDIKDLGVTRVEQALLGKIAGVQVKPASGEPGVAPQIRIRGIGSISAGASPLYVVDGFPIGNIETLNPNDIESLDILKDASATAIYGSRGSNGVIIINTRRGKAGKTNISFDMYTGWQKVSKVPVMMNSREQAQYFYDGVKNNNIDVGNPVTGPATSWAKPVDAIIMDVLEGRNTTDVDALKDVLITAPQSQYQLTATGGNENFKYALSGEYLNQDGIVLNSHFKRYSIRANVDAKLSPRLSVKLNLNPAFTDKTALPVTGNQGENILGSAISVINFFPLIDANGNYTIFNGIGVVADMHNPLALAREYMANQRGIRLLGNVEADYKLSDGLSFRVMLGGSYLNTSGMTFKPQLPVFFNNPASGSSNASAVYNWVAEYTLNYTRSFGKHQFSALGGFTAQKERGDLNSLTSNKYPNNLVPTLSAVSGVITNGTSETYQWSMNSYLGRLNYNYDARYYITASLRTDGSSRFGNENKYGVFPSAALAWRASSEKFLKDVRFLSELKFRTSYGETGNNNIGNYEQFATVIYEKYAFGGGVVGGVAQNRLANPLLTWETQKSFNAGVDASLFHNRVSFSVDHFQSRNYNLLLNVNIPAITGYSTALKNIGEVKNTGWEFVLNTINLDGKFKWATNCNLSTYRNEVVKLGPEGDPIIAGDNKTMIGQPIGMFYGLLTDGVFKNQSELNQGPIFNPGAADRSRVGDIRFKDISGPNGKPDGIINSFDNTLMGSPYPDFYYGMTNRFSYKDFSLSISFQGSYGNKVFNRSFSSGSSTRARVRVYAFNNNYWKSEQDPGDGVTPRPNDAPTGGVRLPSDRNLDDGSYLRINNITLDYVLPAAFAPKYKINGLRFYVSINNPFIFTKYTKYNPDVSLMDDPLRPGLESNDYPLPKSLIIGVKVSF